MLLHQSPPSPTSYCIRHAKSRVSPYTSAFLYGHLPILNHIPPSHTIYTTPALLNSLPPACFTHHLLSFHRKIPVSAIFCMVTPPPYSNKTTPMLFSHSNIIAKHTHPFIPPTSTPPAIQKIPTPPQHRHLTLDPPPQALLLVH